MISELCLLGVDSMQPRIMLIKMQQRCQLLGTAGETELGVSEELESSFQQNLKLLELQ